MKDMMKKATIRISNLPGNELSGIVEEKLIHFLGVDNVEVDYSKKKVSIRYNLRFITYNTLIEKLSLIGHPPSNGLFHAVKKHFIDFTEKNERSGMEISLHSGGNLHGETLSKS